MSQMYCRTKKEQKSTAATTGAVAAVSTLLIAKESKVAKAALAGITAAILGYQFTPYRKVDCQRP